ncbi:MAG: hypothetical protein V7K98_12905 [Nostoc sp.]|uniref:hypothetical protein n=1 Tax=Nostoc sp. TaxID=1180 RepID=UPI002FF7E264
MIRKRYIPHPPTPNSQFPIPNSQFPIPNSQFLNYDFEPVHDCKKRSRNTA